jgi:alpha-glucoside transport system substrate-binding protein
MSEATPGTAPGGATKATGTGDRTDATATTPSAPTAPVASGTLRELDRRKLLLLVLTVLTTFSLFHAYRGVHADAAPLRSASAPGVLAVDTAIDALTQAQNGIDALARAQNGIDRKQGTAGDFHTRMSVANQSLARAAAADVTGLQGRQTIQTVTGLIATYSVWIEDAAAEDPKSLLHEAYLTYARSMLGDPAGKSADETTVLGRLRELRAQQQAVVRRQTDFGPQLWLEWSLAAVLTLALLVLLAKAHHFTGARFRRRWNPALACGFLLLAPGAGVLAGFTWFTHSAMADSRKVLAVSLRGDAIPESGATVADRLAGDGLRAAAAGPIVVGGALLTGLVLMGLQPHINEYRVRVTTRRWPRARTVGVFSVCMAVLAGAGAVVVQANKWNGSVTLLANWTGTTQDQFQRRVIDGFENKYRIHVVYQGSSAESEVLAADVESGTPPDVAVLPGPGELAGYARRGLLTSLDGTVDPADFASTWVTPAVGSDGLPHTYWVPIKTDLKSMVWHRSGTDAAKAAQQQGSWCLGMGGDATSGWPGSDWIEDILLQQTDPDTYRKWATGNLSWEDQRVRRAWTTWGRLVGAGNDAYMRPALTTAFDQAAEGVLEKPQTCLLEHQASGARGNVAWKADASYAPSADVIPGASAGKNLWEVSGDLAAVLHSTPQSLKLIGYLASDEAQRAWAGTQSGFSVKRTVLDGYPTTGTIGRIAGTLRDPKATRCYDASDTMPPTVRDAFDLAVLHYLADPASLDDQLAALDAIRRTDHTPLTTVCSTG